MDWNYFASNVGSWEDELPLNKIIIGLCSPDKDQRNHVKSFFQNRFDNVEFVNQYERFSSGYCIYELCTKTTTKWFAYLHSDVRITENAFRVMVPFMRDKDIGIIESEHLHYDGVKYPYQEYYFLPRSFSGFQIIRKIPMFDFEDDFIYRNEDLILQNYYERCGYRYQKTLAMHIHQTTTTKVWTKSRQKTYEMQWKGLVKYTIPTVITIKACLSALNTYMREFNRDKKDILEEMNEITVLTKEWYDVLKRRLK